jgi:DNA-binding XRE family transcriptional regulator
MENTRDLSPEEIRSMADNAEMFAALRALSIQAAMQNGESIIDVANKWSVSIQHVEAVMRASRMVVRDYPNLVAPTAYTGPANSQNVTEVFDELRKMTRGDAPIHEFRCMWSIGDPISGYEFSASHPGNEAVATGAVEGWTASRLADYLNEQEKERKPFSTTGKAKAAQTDDDEDDEDEPERRRPRQAPKHIREASKPESAERKEILATARKLGPEFKKLRVKAGLSQAKAGELIGLSQTNVSMLERGQMPSKDSKPAGIKMMLADFERNLKTLNLIPSE